MESNTDLIVALTALLVSVITGLVGFAAIRSKVGDRQVDNITFEVKQLREEVDHLKNEVSTYFRENTELRRENLELHRKLTP